MSRPEWVWLGSILGRLSKPLPKWIGLPDVSAHRADLDARYGDLPMIQHLPVPTPKGHPDYDDDPTLADLARLGRKCWGRAKWFGGSAELGPEVYEGLREDIDLARLNLAIDLARFEGIADRWLAAAR